jgi:alpha-galactosidase
MHFSTQKRLFCSMATSALALAMLAPIPPSGWSSWNAFHCTLNETLVLRQAALLVSTGLRDAGFNSMHLDDCVYAPSRDNATGRLLPAHTFPSGFAALSAQLGAINISLGMYSDMGFRTCQGLPGLLDFEETDATTFSAWGVRFLKNDGCFTGS